MSKLHIGKKIREMVDKSNLTITEFAKSINLTRDGAYKIFGKENIDTHQLAQISKVLDHDFFSYYSLAVKDNKNHYGYATKDEVENLSKLVHTLVKEFEKLREELPKTTIKKPVKKKR
jgi:hypothetical protein